MKDFGEESRETRGEMAMQAFAAPLAIALVGFSGPHSIPRRAAVRLSDLDDAAAAAAARETAAARDEGLSKLQELEERMNSRLNQLGASEAPPPPPAVERSAFAISSGQSSEKKAEAAERLQRLRAKDNGELEAEGAAAIAAARRMSKQWADAGLAARAEKELERAAALCSFTSDLGAAVHLEYAAAIEANGRKITADRMRSRVAAEAESSSLRWQADQALAKGGSQRASDSAGNPELNNLFGGFGQGWD